MVETSSDTFAFGVDLLYFPGVFFFLGAAPFPKVVVLLGPVPMSGSGVGVQLDELERLHDVGLRTSFRELSTERGLLSEEEDVLRPNRVPPLPRTGLEGLLSEERYSRE